MSTTTQRFTVIFPPHCDARAEFETPSKGYLGGVQVQIEDGPRYELFFYDPVRLQQDLTRYSGLGTPFVAEPNMVVLPEVTTDSIRKVVAGLVKEDFFRDLKPL